jgi:hypothetical protein
MTAPDPRRSRGKGRLWLGALAVTGCMLSSWLLFFKSPALGNFSEPSLANDGATNAVSDHGVKRRDRDDKPRSELPMLGQAAPELAHAATSTATSATAGELATLLPHQRALVEPHWRVLEGQLRVAGSQPAAVKRVRLEQQRLASAARQVTLPTSTRP